MLARRLHHLRHIGPSVPWTLPSARDSFWLIVALCKSPQRPPHLVDNSINTTSQFEPSPNHQQDNNNSTSRIPRTNPITKLSLAAFAIAILADAAVAANCEAGLEYCGNTLLKKGMVQQRILR